MRETLIVPSRFSARPQANARADAGRPPQLVPAWYVVAPAASLPRGGILRFTLDGEEIVLFRGRGDGAVRALPAYCEHQGVDLAHGDVAGDRLRCPLHYWEYGTHCEHIPGRGPVSGRRFVPRYHAAERYGMIFLYAGGTPSHPIPSFSVPDDALYFRAGSPVSIACPWFVPVANAFDMSHLATVHRRRLVATPLVTQSDDVTFKVRYSTAVSGRGWSDRAMRLLSGNQIDVDVTCSGGTIVVVESQIRAHRSFLMVSIRPAAKGVSILPFFGVRRRRSGAHHLHARLSAVLFTAFLSRDIRPLDGIRWPDGFLDNDDQTINACYRYLCELPEARIEERV